MVWEEEKVERPTKKSAMEKPYQAYGSKVETNGRPKKKKNQRKLMVTRMMFGLGP